LIFLSLTLPKGPIISNAAAARACQGSGVAAAGNGEESAVAGKESAPSASETLHWVREQNIWRHRSRLADGQDAEHGLIRQLLMEEEALMEPEATGHPDKPDGGGRFESPARAADRPARPQRWGRLWNLLSGAWRRRTDGP
jgi:hypothetical protein